MSKLQNIERSTQFENEVYKDVHEVILEVIYLTTYSIICYTRITLTTQFENRSDGLIRGLQY